MMLDPYLYPQTRILQNKFGIKEQDALDKAEAEYTSLRLAALIDEPIDGNYDFAHLAAIHTYIFSDIYQWAGKPRSIDIIKLEPLLSNRSIDYSPATDIEQDANKVIQEINQMPWENLSLEEQAKEFSRLYAALWKVHPFREGNTRTVTHYCTQFADAHQMPIDKKLLAKNAEYLRGALVAYNAKFAENDLGDKSKPEYLEKIILDAMQRGKTQAQEQNRRETADKNPSKGYGR